MSIQRRIAGIVAITAASIVMILFFVPLIHGILILMGQARINTNLVRAFKAAGSTLTLTTPPITIGGVVQTTVLEWKRTL